MTYFEEGSCDHAAQNEELHQSHFLCAPMRSIYFARCRKVRRTVRYCSWGNCQPNDLNMKRKTLPLNNCWSQRSWKTVCRISFEVFKMIAEGVNVNIARVLARTYSLNEFISFISIRITVFQRFVIGLLRRGVCSIG